MKKFLLMSFSFCSAVFIMAQMQKIPQKDTSGKNSLRTKTDMSKKRLFPQKDTSVAGMPVAKPEDSIKYAALKGPKRDDSLYHMPNRKIPSFKYEPPKTIIPKKIQGAK